MAYIKAMALWFAALSLWSTWGFIETGNWALLVIACIDLLAVEYYCRAIERRARDESKRQG